MMTRPQGGKRGESKCPNLPLKQTRCSIDAGTNYKTTTNTCSLDHDPTGTDAMEEK